MRLPIIKPSKETNLNIYLKTHQSYIFQKAFVFGAILFRGWDEASTRDLMMTSLDLTPFTMTESAAPRTRIEEGVFTANDAPPECNIPFHHELGQRRDMPSYLMFQCKIPSVKGGSTPLVDSREIAKWMKGKYPTEYEKMKLGLRYRRVMPEVDDASSAIGKSWKTTYDIQSAEELEYVLEEGTEHYWHDNMDLETISAPLAGIQNHTRSSQPVFANSMIAARLGWNDVRNDGEESVTYSDGSKIDAELAKSIEAQMKFRRLEFTWEAGDILLIDNSVTMHSRTPFQGDRLLYTSLSGPPYVRNRMQGIFLPSWDIMPSIAFGCWKLKNAEMSVYRALLSGFRHIDSSPDYVNEKQVGQALKQAFKDQVVSRSGVFVTSKLWNTHHNHVEEACRRTLSDLGLTFLDMYLVHFPISLSYTETTMCGWTRGTDPMSVDRVPFHMVWKQMEDLVRKGLVRNIGVCNLPCAMLSDLLSYAEIPPSVLQVEIHPWNSQSRLRQYCKQEGVRVEAFSPLGPTGYTDTQESLLDHPLVCEIAENRKCSKASVLLEWSRRNVDVTIVQSENIDHMRENLKSAPLLDDDIRRLDKINQNKRYNDPGVFTPQFGGFEPIFD